MKLAFWKAGKQPRRDRASPAAAGTEPDFETALDDGNADQAQVEWLRARARRRLIGAAALLLLVVVLVPMILDPTPRTVPDNIPIDLPSDRTPFAPKLATPPAETSSTASDVKATVPAAPGSAADAAAVAGDAAAGETHPNAVTGTQPPRSVADGAAKPDSNPVPHKSDARADAGAGRIYVQAAALGKESAAKELASRLGKSGLTSFVERTESNGTTHYRVRLGPFATRDEAEHARARLHALGVNSNIVGV